MSSIKPSLKGSANYIWWEKDELGKGATATVYKCREKKTGDVYAVKVFSSRHRERHNFQESAQQEREFTLLKKLKHENIVQMLSIEEESQSERIPSKVIVMEYCNEGSLYSILEKPCNAYGLEETEFLRFLRHISEGLRYLREQRVVHRDIKPGNIMKLSTSEGRSIYKLTDFGAARELEENDESFASVYGTEEYLHPDLYDRAVMRNALPFGSSKKSFTSSVDLWSVGVTIYHVATGSLPFRPYGGRRNRQDMQRILLNKKPNVISGVCERQGGDIRYCEHLPDTCTLSDGLQQQIVPVIAGLLEVNINLCSDFEKFFSQATTIVTKTIVTLFDSCHCNLVKIYCDPRDDLYRMKELIQKQCGYRPVEQLLLYENSKLDELVAGQNTERTFPVTSSTNPVFLYHCVEPLIGTEEFPKKHHIPRFSRFGSAYDLEKDYQLAKNCTGIMIYISGKVQNALTLQALLDKAVKVYEHYLIRMVVLLRDNILMVVNAAYEVRMRHSFMKNMATLLRGQTETEARILEKFIALERKIEEMEQFIKDLQKYGEDYKEKLADRKELSCKWKRSNGCDVEKDMCYAKVASLAQNVENCMNEFHSDRKQKTLPYNEEQIHKFEKNKMSESCTSALSLLDDHCWDRTKKMYRLFIQWFQMAFRIQTKINKLKAKMDRLQAMHSEVSHELSNSDRELVQLVNSKIMHASHVPHSLSAQMAGDDFSDRTSGIGSMREDAFQDMNGESLERFISKETEQIGNYFNEMNMDLDDLKQFSLQDLPSR